MFSLDYILTMEREAMEGRREKSMFSSCVLMLANLIYVWYLAPVFYVCVEKRWRAQKCLGGGKIYFCATLGFTDREGSYGVWGEGGTIF